MAEPTRHQPYTLNGAQGVVAGLRIFMNLSLIEILHGC